MKDVSLKTYHLSLSRMNILILLSSPPYGPFPARRTGGTAITAAGKSLGPSRGRPRWRMDGERSPKHPEKHHNFRGHEIIHFGGIKKHCQWKVIISWPLFFWAVQCIWVCDFFFSSYTLKSSLLGRPTSSRWWFHFFWFLSCSLVFGDDEPSFDKYVYIETKSFLGGETLA